MAVFTTWGRWEEVRLMIQQTLLINIPGLDENELSNFLLSEVVSTMLRESNEYLKKNVHRWSTEKKQVLLDFYSVCLGSTIILKNPSPDCRRGMILN